MESLLDGNNNRNQDSEVLLLANQGLTSPFEKKFKRLGGGQPELIAPQQGVVSDRLDMSWMRSIAHLAFVHIDCLHFPF